MTEDKEKKYIELLSIATLAIDECLLYRGVGTIEEFRRLKEKSVAKKLLTREEKHPSGYGIFTTADRWCPTCKRMVFDGCWSNYKQSLMYGRLYCNCGQLLDWKK